MRLGFFLGFLIGAGIATFLSLVEREEDDATLLTSTPDAGGTPENFVEKVKHQAREAKQAAEEASLEKQAEMLRQYEATIHREPRSH